MRRALTTASLAAGLVLTVTPAAHAASHPGHCNFIVRVPGAAQPCLVDREHHHHTLIRPHIGGWGMRWWLTASH